MRGRIAAAGLVFAGVLAACGGDDDAPAGNPGAAGSSTGGASGKGGSSGAAGQGGSSKGGTGGSAGAATGGSAGKSGSAGSTQGGAAGTAGGGPGGSAGNAGATSTGGTAGSAGTAGTSSTGGTAGSAGKGAGGSTAGSAGAGAGAGGKAGNAGNGGSSAGSSTGGSSAGTSGSGGSNAGNGGTSAGNGGTTAAGNGGTTAGGNGGSGSGSHPGAGFPVCDNSLACGAFAIFGTSDLGTSHPCLSMYEKFTPLQMCACQPAGPIPGGCADVCGSTSYCSQFPTKLPNNSTPCGKCLVNQDPTPGAKSCAVFVGNCQAANPAKPACNTCQAAYRLYNFGTNPEVCTNNGPPTSEALFKTLVECTQKECAAECAPGNFQCEGCATTKCKGAFDACAGG